MTPRLLVAGPPCGGKTTYYRARYTPSGPTGGGPMSLRVQARDSYGNIFAWATAPDEGVALDLACSWIEQLPGLTVEVVPDV
jgi:hypothetical protein